MKKQFRFEIKDSKNDVEKILNHKKAAVSYLDAKQADGRMLQSIKEYNKLSTSAMANVFGVKEATMEHWLAGRDIPNAAKMLIVLLDKHPKVIDLIREVYILEGEENEN